MWITEDDMSRAMSALRPDHQRTLAWALQNRSALTFSSISPIKTMGTLWQDRLAAHPESWLLQGYLYPRDKIEFSTEHPPLTRQTVLNLFERIRISQHDALPVNKYGQIGYPGIPYVDVSQRRQELFVPFCGLVSPCRQLRLSSGWLAGSR